jgi:ribose-phosphate pyrophosphokinase
MKEVLVLATRTGEQMADSLVKLNQRSDLVNMKRVSVSRKKFSNGEVYTRVCDNIRRKNVYVVMSGYSFEDWSINDTFVETLVLLDACKRADVASITLICPCFPYIRQDKKQQSREPISAKVMAGCIEKYVNRVAVVDSHFSQFQGFFDIPVDNLYCVYGFCHYIADNYLGQLGQNRDMYVLVSPDGGGAKRIEHYARLLEMNHVIMNKKRDYTKSNSVISTELYNESETNMLEGKYAIVIDDIIDSAGTINESCKTLDRYGIEGYILVATHGIFSKPAMERINANEKILAVLVSDSVPVPKESLSEKVHTVSIASLLHHYITELETEGSVSALFEDIPIFNCRDKTVTDNEIVPRSLKRTPCSDVDVTVHNPLQDIR